MKIKDIILTIIYKLNLRMEIRFPRPFQKYALKGEDLVGVEIGVFKGDNSLSLLKKSSIKKLFLIDSYIPYEGYCDFIGRDFNKIEKIAHKRLARFGNKVIWIKKKSINAIKDIPNNLDFIYIDGNHNYKSVKEDIENYYPKLKTGGILAGHDFIKAGEDFRSKDYGVIEAVMEFTIKNNLKLYIWEKDWWVIKDKLIQKEE